MRSTFQLVAFLILMSTLVYSQQSGTSPEVKLRYETGKIAQGLYSNECLGLSFPLPPAWQLNTKVVGEDGTAQHIAGGIALLVLFQQSANSGANTFALMADEASTQTESAQDFVSNYARLQINAKPSEREFIREPYAVDYGEGHFFRADFKQLFPSTNATLFVSPILTKFRGYFVGAVVVARSVEEVNQAADLLLHLSFQQDQVDPRCVMSTHDFSIGQRVRISKDVQKGLLIKKVPPDYPEIARQARVQGSVVMHAVIDKNGNIQDLKLISGHAMLAPAAMKAVKDWKYRPYLLQGQPMEVETEIVVNFSLSGG